MIYDAITSTGSVYRIDSVAGFWSKHSPTPTGYYAVVHMDRLLELSVGTSLTWPWDAPEDWKKTQMPEVGKHMFISSFNVWFATTPLTHIIPVDGWDIEKYPLTIIINGEEENVND